MEVSNMKNMVVLKNLPSNIVEEAYVVLKANKRIKNLEKVENSKKLVSENKIQKDSTYMLKEAEMLVTDYISKIENVKNDNKIIENNKKNKKLKKYAYISTAIAVLEGIVLLSI